MLAELTSIPTPLLVYAALVVAVEAGMLALSYGLGQRHRGGTADEPYESGMPPTGSVRGRIPAGFYRVGLLFVIFELEAAFIFAWAVAARDVGWAGYVGILVFLGLLLVALFYLWRVGALDWATSQPPQRAVPGKKEDLT